MTVDVFLRRGCFSHIDLALSSITTYLAAVQSLHLNYDFLDPMHGKAVPCFTNLRPISLARTVDLSTHPNVADVTQLG